MYKIFDALERIAPLIPTPVYWLNTNFVIMGGNDICLEAIGNYNTSTFKEALVGRTYYDYYPDDIAKELTELVRYVLTTQQATKTEEKIVDLTTGKFRYYETGRAPLFDDSGTLVGTICLAIEITDKREAQQLRLDATRSQTALEQQLKFREFVQQVVHDIRSPIATLTMLGKHCTDLPDTVRFAFKNATVRLDDITNRLAQQYKPENEDHDDSGEILVSTGLFDIISEKKYEFSEHNVVITPHISGKASFAFIRADPVDFKRMISNLINNAIAAFTNKIGNIDIYLKIVDKTVELIINDNGKGMPAEILQKIISNESITFGKKDGSGLGLTHARENIAKYNGTLKIESKENIGTKITITFPKVSAPKWIAGKIPLNMGDLVVILDDDDSIHSAWNTFFEPYTNNIRIKHFSNGLSAINFINNLSPRHRTSTFLLTDYELLKQEVNGLDVVAQTKMTRAILVTSHHADKNIRERAAKIKTRILPKPLSHEVRVVFSNDNSAQFNLFDSTHILSFNSEQITHFKEVDLVILDDDEDIIDNLKIFILKNKIVDSYTNVREFIQHVSEYTTSTKMLIDYSYVNEKIDGIEIIEVLQSKGYTNCYLYSGMQFAENDLPANINVIMKSDLHKITDICGVTSHEIHNSNSSPQSQDSDLFSLNSNNLITKKPYTPSSSSSIINTTTEQLARKISHDIRTPIASLEAIIQASATISEVERLALKRLSSKLSDIANNVLDEYTSQKSKREKEVIILLYDALTNIIQAQNYCDNNFSVNFDAKNSATFAAIKITESSFTSMVTELLKAAAKALEDLAAAGKLIVSLNINGEFAVITIEDNAGKYLSDELVDKIHNNEPIDAHNPHNDYAIKLSKISAMLKNILGSLLVYYTLDARTKVVLRIPLATFPNWLATQITLRDNDQILILGLNSTEYSNWQIRILENSPQTQLNQIKPLQNISELNNFIASTPPDKLDNICLIGNAVILQKYAADLKTHKATIALKRIILTDTSYNNDTTIATATTLNAKVLPESLSQLIPIIFEEQIIPQSKVVDMVWLDDEKMYLDDMVERFYNHLAVDKYYDPTTFLDYFSQYPFDTKIFLDHNYYSCDNYKFDVDGVSVAATLHTHGYTNLFLISGEAVADKPHYLTIILKTDNEALCRLNTL